jgi:CYTH domain-containing protein
VQTVIFFDMGTEIEKKFLVRGDAWRSLAKGKACKQGYLNSSRERTVRVRTIGGKGYLTIKGPQTRFTRAEYEYQIPLGDADALLRELCEKPIIEKRRYRIVVDGLAWEVDEFFGENRGLIVAEIELLREDQAFTKPDWVGEEVTEDPRYFNSNLVVRPFTTW